VDNSLFVPRSPIIQAKKLDAAGANASIALHRQGAENLSNVRRRMSRRKLATDKSVSSDRCTDFFELRVRICTDRSDCSQADDDDQGQHHSVLNCGRAIFFFQ
jgi:hypothetical protein